MNEWISIKDRMPKSDYDRDILIYIPNYPGVSIGFCWETDLGLEIFDRIERIEHKNKITHWMEISEAPND